jgi:hypothetical protein
MKKLLIIFILLTIPCTLQTRATLISGWWYYSSLGRGRPDDTQETKARRQQLIKQCKQNLYDRTIYNAQRKDTWGGPVALCCVAGVVKVAPYILQTASSYSKSLSKLPVSQETASYTAGIIAGCAIFSYLYNVNKNALRGNNGACQAQIELQDLNSRT